MMKVTLRGQLVDVGNLPGGAGVQARLDDDEACDVLTIHGLPMTGCVEAARMLYADCEITIEIKPVQR